MVRECVPIFIHELRRIWQTNERGMGEWVSNSSKPENKDRIKEPTVKYFVKFICTDRYNKVLLLHYQSRDKINTKTTISERHIFTTINMIVSFNIFEMFKFVFDNSKSENLIFKSYISHNTTSLNVQWECSSTFKTVKTYQVQTCTKFQEKSLSRMFMEM